MLNLFKKSAARTLREAGNRVDGGWSSDTPTKQDAKGNVTHYCAEAALASVHRGNPRAWKFLKAALTPVSNVANRLNGIAVVGLVNCQPGMTKEVIVAAFSEAEAAARAAGA